MTSATIALQEKRNGMIPAIVVMEADTAAAISMLQQRDGLSMPEYQKRAAQAYALMFPGWPYPPRPGTQRSE
jgi:hypothetical protein